MPNHWNIPDELEKKVRARDKNCVYCGIEMKAHSHGKGTPGDKMTWEHIDNDEKNFSEGNIALCCARCNSSKGARGLVTWFNSPYCLNKGINKKTVAILVRRCIKDVG